jgi:hypothetical protein
MKATFDSDHVQRLLDESEAANGKRRGNFVQNYDVSFLRDDVSAARRKEIALELDSDGISFAIDPETEIDPAKIPAGLWLVGDQGVYLMSNAAERNEQVAYADQSNPEKMDFDEWWNAKQDIFGADDGVEFLSIEGLRRGLNPGGKITLEISSQEISIELPPKTDDAPSP